MIEQDGKRPWPPRAAARDVGQLSHRVLTLLELHADLLKVDAKDSLSASTRPIALLVGGLVFGLSSVPILLIAVAHALREWAGFSWTASYAVAALTGLLIAGATIALGWRLLRKGLAAFDRSKLEFRRNLASLKRALSRAEPAESNCEHIR